MSTVAPLNLGIAGLGRLGKRHALNFAQKVPGATLVAACSPVADELAWARRELGVSALYADYAHLLAHPGLDAVVLVTPTTLHAAQITDALNAGKHVFCEKPLSLDVEDCLRVEETQARHPNVKVLIGFVRRFDASYQDAYARVTRGDIGRPFYVRSQSADKNDPSGFFVRFAPTSGGIFLDMNVHDIDCARWFLGGPKIARAFAAGTIAVHQGLKECGDVDNGLAICEFEDGSLAHFYATRTLAHGHESLTEIVGTAGRLTVGQNPRLDRVDIADAYGVPNECTPTFWERFEDAFLREAQAFVDMVRENRPPPVTLADATEATRIGRMLTQSFRAHAVVEADERSG